MAGFGLRLGRSQGMEGYTGNTFDFPIDPATADAIFTGDPVVLSGGYVEASGTTTAAILGVFNGCKYVDNDGSYEFRSFWDGNTGRSEVMASICMPGSSMFHVKLAAPSSQAAAVGNTAALTAAAGNAQYGDSRYVATLGAGPLVIHRLAPLPGNAWTNAQPIVEVSVALQQGTASDAA